MISDHSAADTEPDGPAGDVRTYRGRTLAAILPQIREELGPNAIILREREGLVGGISGFFAQRFVEVDARPGVRSVDVYGGGELEPPIRVSRRPAPTQAAGVDDDEFLARLRTAAAAWAQDPAPGPGPASPAPAALPAAAAANGAVDRKRAASVDPPGKPRGPAKPKPAAATKPKPAVTKPRAAATKPKPAATKPRAAATKPKPAATAKPRPAAATPVPATSTTRPRGLRAAIARILSRYRRGAVPAIAPPQPLDRAAAANITSDLIARGAGHVFAAQLISAAATHGTPFASGLRDGARDELARRIVLAPALPPGGAAIALVGAGGSGKTQCALSLASAYRRSSTLPVSVACLDGAGGGELTDALADRGIRCEVGTPQAVSAARHGGLVIVDTPATAPTDADALRALADRLEPLILDAVYVMLPATLGPQAARRALAGFTELRPTALVITHADETDQLAVAVEIAVTHRIPIAFLRAGIDPDRAASRVDPATIAAQLLP